MKSTSSRSLLGFELVLLLAVCLALGFSPAQAAQVVPNDLPGTSGTAKTVAPPEAVPPTAAKPDILTIGVLVPQSGRFQIVGDQTLKGVELAAEVFGRPQAGGARVAVRDCGAGAEAAAAGLRQLAAEEGAQVVIALLGSSHARRVGQEAKQLGLPLLALCRDAGLPCGEMVFRNFLTSRGQVEHLAAFAKERNLLRLAIVWPQDAYGKEMAALMRAEASRRGLKVVAEAGYDPKQSNIAANLKALAPKTPVDAVFLPEGCVKAAVLIPQFAHAGLRNIKFLGPNLWNDPRFVVGLEGSSIEAFFPDAFQLDSPDPAVNSFVEGYRGLFGEDPSYVAAQSYDDARMALAAFASGAKSRPAVARALAATKDFAGVTGTTSLSAKGDAKKALCTLTIRQRRITPVQ
ncbi:MAG: penicillin-binding protein activator [Pseudomonadota bacterium]